MENQTIILHPKELDVFKNLVADDNIIREIIEVIELTDSELEEWIATRPELENSGQMVRTRPIKVTYKDTFIS